MKRFAIAAALLLVAGGVAWAASVVPYEATALSSGQVPTSSSTADGKLQASSFTDNGSAATFTTVNGSSNVQSGSTYTMVASDCGKTIINTLSSGDATYTIPASIVPASGTVCNILVQTTVAHKALVNGSAVTAATLVSADSWVGTAATAGATIAIQLTTIGATTTATILGGKGA